MSNDPITVLLQLAFIAVLYLFLLWVARSALKDLRRPPAPGGVVAEPSAERVSQPPLIEVQGGHPSPGVSR